jgi:DNA-binding NarL/FixJ family response regulator
MTRGSVRTITDPLQLGWAELSDGHWLAARSAFETALESEEKPEAFEGLSWAEWWLDEADAVFAARGRAFALYRSAGDARGAARMATWLGADNLDFRGSSAVASGWLRRAHRLLDPLEPCPEHGWLAFHEGYIACLQGDTARSSQLATRAAELGRRFGVPDLEMLGLALHGSLLVERAEIEEGMACLDEAAAAALAGEARIPISGAWTCCFLVSACEAVRDYARAFEWCDRIAEFSERYGSRYMLAFCRAHYGKVHVWRGRWTDAESALEAAIDAYSRSRPPYVTGALAELAELRRQQGRWEDAERLLDSIGPNSAPLCRARLALDRGDAREAVDLAERALRQLAEPRMIQRAPALELLVRARAASGEAAEAVVALDALRDLATRVGTPPLRAAAALAEAVAARACGDHETARTRLEDAIDGFEQSGAPFEAAHARVELATTLATLGRHEAAEREARIAFDGLTRLGAVTEARRAERFLGASLREPAPIPAITRREREVLRLVAVGLTNRQIAARLFVSEHTVHRHITNILRKLNLPSRTAAAALAARSGLLEPP